jgi:RimJ/RimL family protein N-acetyltransferase
VSRLQIPTLVADRVQLEPLALSHSMGMFDLWRQAEVCEHSGAAFDSLGEQIPLPAASNRESDRLLQYWLARAQDGTGFRWAVVLSPGSEFVGAVGFNVLGPCAEYAYHFAPQHWGAGLATEASRLALSWCFSSGAESVEVFISADNTRSIRLAMRLGFEGPESGLEEPGRFVMSRDGVATSPAR